MEMKGPPTFEELHMEFTKVTLNIMVDNFKKSFILINDPLFRQNLMEESFPKMALGFATTKKATTNFMKIANFPTTLRLTKAGTESMEKSLCKYNSIEMKDQTLLFNKLLRLMRSMTLIVLAQSSMRIIMLPNYSLY